MRINQALTAAIVAGCVACARADLLDFFTDYITFNDIGVSGLESSYYYDTKNSLPVTGPTTGTLLPVLGPNRVTYPSGVGQVPSPGGGIGKHFDQGLLGVKVENGNLIVRLAGGLDPQTGYYHSGWKTWYGQGDLFLSIFDSRGVSHYALLSAWARDSQGQPISLNGGHFSAAQNYHVAGGAGASSLEGHLVRLESDSQVTLTGGNGAYHPGIAPIGLDLRTFASGGTDLGYANLVHNVVHDLGQNWYLQTWTVGLGTLSADGTFVVGMHAAPSCGNDQIGGEVSISIPEPSSIGLLAIGALLLLGLRRVC